MNKEEYMKLFESEEKTEIDKKHIEAFKLAIDTRKFEIELYWKRATYFWAFIAVTFAGYGWVYRLPPADRGFLDFLLACFGLILSFAWYFANRGSKQWQENWEHHVDHLEDLVTGPLYKTVLRRQLPTKIWQWPDFIFLGPSKHSVSKINQLVSLYVTCMWAVIVWKTQSNWLIGQWTSVDQSIFVLTLLALAGIALGARTFSGDFGHHVHPRESNIIEKVKK